MKIISKGLCWHCNFQNTQVILNERVDLSNHFIHDEYCTDCGALLYGITKKIEGEQ